MSCLETGCPLEAISQCPAISPGPVRDEEFVHRAAFAPTHVSNSRRLKTSITEISKLIGEGISVWRSNGSPKDVEKVHSKIPARDGQTYEALFGVRARDIRDIRIPSHGGRVFCVIDDCVVDDGGNTDPLHAGIRVCDQLRNEELTAESSIAVELKAQLRLVFLNNQCWGAAVQP